MYAFSHPALAQKPSDFSWIFDYLTSRLQMDYYQLLLEQTLVHLKVQF